jgi:hypothetical protein
MKTHLNRVLIRRHPDLLSLSTIDLSGLVRPEYVLLVDRHRHELITPLSKVVLSRDIGLEWFEDCALGLRCQFASMVDEVGESRRVVYARLKIHASDCAKGLLMLAGLFRALCDFLRVV